MIAYLQSDLIVESVHSASILRAACCRNLLEKTEQRQELVEALDSYPLHSTPSSREDSIALSLTRCDEREMELGFIPTVLNRKVNIAIFLSISPQIL